MGRIHLCKKKKSYKKKKKQPPKKAFIWLGGTHLSQFDYAISCVTNANASNHLPSPTSHWQAAVK